MSSPAEKSCMPVPSPGVRPTARVLRRYSASTTPTSHTSPSEIDLVNLVSQLNTLELPSKKTLGSGGASKCNRKSKLKRVRFELTDDISEQKCKQSKRRSSPCPVNKKKLCSDGDQSDRECVMCTSAPEISFVSGDTIDTNGEGEGEKEIGDHEEMVLDRNNNNIGTITSSKRSPKKQCVRKSKSDPGITLTIKKKRTLAVISKKSGLKRNSKDSGIGNNSCATKRKFPSIKGQGDGCQKQSKQRKVTQKGRSGKAFGKRKGNTRPANTKPRSKPKSALERKRKRSTAVVTKKKRSRKSNIGKEVVRTETKRNTKSYSFGQKWKLKFSIEQLWKEFKAAKKTRQCESKKSQVRTKLSLKQLWREYTQLKLDVPRSRKLNIRPIERRGDPFEIGESLRVDLLKYLLCQKMTSTGERCCTRKCCKCWEEIDAQYMEDEHGD